MTTPASKPQPLPSANPPQSGSLVIFFLLSYALMWACFITVAVAVRATTLLGQALLLLGAYSPSFAALWLTARHQGSTGISNLLSGILLWRVALRWYVFAAGYMLFIKLASAIIHRLIWGEWPRFGDLPWYMVVAAVLFSTPFQAGEEIGWRGYALPRMAARFGLSWASVLLGVIWAGWHLPQFFIREADTYHQAFLVWALQVTALSVAFAWLYIRTNRSLLLPMLLHSAINNSKDVVPSAMSGAPPGILAWKASCVAWIGITLLWICAGYFLVRMSKMKAPAQG